MIMEECSICHGMFANGALKKCPCCKKQTVCMTHRTECYHCDKEVCDNCIQSSCSCGQEDRPHCNECVENDPCGDWTHYNGGDE